MRLRKGMPSRILRNCSTGDVFGISSMNHILYAELSAKRWGQNSSHGAICCGIQSDFASKMTSAEISNPNERTEYLGHQTSSCKVRENRIPPARIWSVAQLRYGL